MLEVDINITINGRADGAAAAVKTEHNMVNVVW